MKDRLAPLATLDDARLAAISVVATDVDDTITDGGKLALAALDAIARLDAAGVRVVLVTGRSTGWGQALAAYLPGVSAVIAENGLVACAPDEHAHPLFPPDLLGGRFAERLAATAATLATRLAPTSDSPARLYERTFHAPRGRDAADLRAWAAAVAAEHDLDTTVSTIHLHARPRGFGKADGLRAWLREAGLDAARTLTVGDSPNDAPLFSAFSPSIGVRNVLDWAGTLGDDTPEFVTERFRAAGFVEVADRVLGALARAPGR